MVDERGRKPDGRRPGDLAYIASFARLLRANGGRIDPQIEVAGHGHVAWALISKGPVYTYAGAIPMRVAPRAGWELGLDLLAPKAIHLRSFPRLLAYALTGRGQERASDIVYVHDADRLELRADRPLPLQADGEDLGDADEVLLEAERNAVAVLVGPADASH
jgi:diacylglycerol kinase family enzyme